jgi:hypothetical protein
VLSIIFEVNSVIKLFAAIRNSYEIRNPMELIEDLVQIKLLDDQIFQEVIDVLSNEPEELEQEHLLDDLSKQSDEKSIKALIRFLNFLSDNVSDSGNFASQIKEIDEFLTKLLNDDPDALDSWGRIKNTLANLENLFLKKKEARIKSDYSRVTSFKVVTDIRPIFSMDKKSISKLTYPNILKIETCDGKEFLCEFYEDALEKFINELEAAKDKLQLIKDSYVRI